VSSQVVNEHTEIPGIIWHRVRYCPRRNDMSIRAAWRLLVAGMRPGRCVCRGEGAVRQVR